MNSGDDSYIPPGLLAHFSHFISKHMGLYFPAEKYSDLVRGINAAKTEFGFKSTVDCCSYLLSHPLKNEQIEILAGYLTVGETYFFRDKKTFDALEKEILPDIIQERKNKDKRIRIWSAGCCTGEEAYSVAIILHKLLKDIDDWNITILATDINPVFLKKANSGLYTKWSFRETTEHIKKEYFQSTDNKQFSILPEIRKMVTFSYLNLASDRYPSLKNNTNAMDIITCRNVLMYFIPELTKKISLKLRNSLSENGLLLVNPVEVNYLPSKGMEPVSFDGVMLYKKNSKIKSGKNVSQDFKAYPEVAHEKAIAELPSLIVNDLSFEKEYKTIEDKPVEFVVNVNSENAMESKSENTDIILSLFNAGQYDEAEKLILKKISDENKNTEEYIYLAKINANKGNLSEAVTWLDKAIVEDKFNPEYTYLKGVINLELGKIDEATVLLKQVLYLDHNYVSAYLTLSSIKLREGKTFESQKYLRVAEQILNKYPDGYIITGSEGITAGHMLSIIKSSKIERAIIN